MPYGICELIAHELGGTKTPGWSIKCRIKTQRIKQWRVGREMNRRIKNTFDAKRIEIPFPHQTIYWGEPMQGTPPPLYVAGLQPAQPVSH